MTAKEVGINNIKPLEINITFSIAESRDGNRLCGLGLCRAKKENSNKWIVVGSTHFGAGQKIINYNPTQL